MVVIAEMRSGESVPRTVRYCQSAEHISLMDSVFRLLCGAVSFITCFHAKAYLNIFVHFSTNSNITTSLSLKVLQFFNWFLLASLFQLKRVLLIWSFCFLIVLIVTNVTNEVMIAVTEKMAANKCPVQLFFIFIQIQ